MSFSMTVVIPNDSKELVKYYGTPHIVDGMKWVLAVQRLYKSYKPLVVTAWVMCRKIEEPVLYKSTVSLTYPNTFTSNVEMFDINNKEGRSRYNEFRDSDVDQVDNHSYSLTVNVKLDLVEPEKQKKTPNCQNEQSAGATCNDQDHKSLINQLEEMKVKVKRAQFKEENEMLKGMKKSESEAQKEIEHLKAELEVANQKVMETEKKVELMQRVIVETEATMIDLKKKNKEFELAMKTRNCTESVEYTANYELLEEKLKKLEAENVLLVKNAELAEQNMKLSKRNDELSCDAISNLKQKNGQLEMVIEKLKAEVRKWEDSNKKVESA